MESAKEASGDFGSTKRPPSGEMKLASGSQESSSMDQGTRDNVYIHNLPLCRAVDSGDWEATKRFLDAHPNVLSASISSYGDTALHIAALAGHMKIIEELVKLMPAQDLELRNLRGTTALSFVAAGGTKKAAKLMVNKNPNLLTIPNQYGYIPVVVASINGRKDMVKYLYSVTPMKELSPEASKNGVMLLTSCIFTEIYDIALDLLQHYRRLAIVLDNEGESALNMLARKTSAFPSGSRLVFWQRWMYSCIHVRPPHASSNIHEDIERPREGPIDREKMITQALNQLLGLVWNLLKLVVPGINHVYDRKLKHVQAHELLSSICREISTLDEAQQFKNIGVYTAVFDAIENGIDEVIVEIVKSYPDIVWCVDDNNRGIFLYATLQRQENIFSLLYGMGAKTYSIASSWDEFGNNMLHQAAILAPSSQLDRVSGAALQMQRELQWFKEVENIVQPRFIEMVNAKGRTPRALFTEEHKKLVEEGERWMKDTATSCTVVAALIATIMFAVAFTVPGGYHGDTGIPIFLHRNSFIIFIISDALSLFSSSTSVLMFLGILTSRYRDEDFLKSLPTKLIIGLSALFFSIATMMTTFGITLVIVLRERLAWISIPIILFAGIPVTLFALLQFPLLVEIFISTYGPGIFKKPKKLWF